jgi:hypothetical protein
MHAWLNQHVRMDTLLKDFGHKTLISGVVQCFLPTCSSSAEKWMQKKLHSICQTVECVWLSRNCICNCRYPLFWLEWECVLLILKSLSESYIVCTCAELFALLWLQEWTIKCSWCLLPVSKFLDLWHMSFSIWSLVPALPLQVILSLFNELKNWQDFWTGDRCMDTDSQTECSLMIFILLRKRWADI